MEGWGGLRECGGRVKRRVQVSQGVGGGVNKTQAVNARLCSDVWGRGVGTCGTMAATGQSLGNSARRWVSSMGFSDASLEGSRITSDYDCARS